MSAQAHMERVLSRPEFIGLVAALMALNALAIDVMLPALPYMGEALGVTNENERQLVVSAYMIGFGAAQLAFGPITDRFGRRAPLFFGIVLTAITSLQVFDQVYALTRGGPGAATQTLGYKIYRDGFISYNFGYASSVAWILFVIIMVLTAVQLRLQRKWVHYDA